MSSPPPYDKFTEPDAWLAWWGDCLPSGVLGPGADDCDLEAAWFDALEFCCDERRAYAASIGLDPDDQPCNDNYVQYVWLDENCTVVDAWCGYASEVAPAIWVSAAFIVIVGLTYPDDIAQESPPAGGTTGGGSTGSSGATSGSEGNEGTEPGEGAGTDTGGESGDTGEPETTYTMTPEEMMGLVQDCLDMGGDMAECAEAVMDMGQRSADEEDEGQVWDPQGDEDLCGDWFIVC